MRCLLSHGPIVVLQLGISGFLFSAISGVINFVATFPAIALIDRTGRMVLLRYSAGGMALSCVVIAAVGDTCIEDVHCAYLAAAAIFVFIFSFAFGWGPVVWVYCVTDCAVFEPMRGALAARTLDAYRRSNESPAHVGRLRSSPSNIGVRPQGSRPPLIG